MPVTSAAGAAAMGTGGAGAAGGARSADVPGCGAAGIVLRQWEWAARRIEVPERQCLLHVLRVVLWHSLSLRCRLLQLRVTG